MDKIDSVKKFKEFLMENSFNLIEKAISIENLPVDDEWLNDSSWNETVLKGEKE